jgi:nitroreductase
MVPVCEPGSSIPLTFYTKFPISIQGGKAMADSGIDDLYKEIFRRKSVRRFERRKIDRALMEKIEAAIAAAFPLTDTPAALRILQAEEAGLSFGGAQYCLGAYAKNENAPQLNAAFMLQEMSLRLSSLGLGSCWVGMAKPKGPLAKYQGLPFFKLIAFGFPAETLHRGGPSGSGAFNRKPLAAITNIQNRDDLLEAVRLAPSAMNRQGWYLSQVENKIRLHMVGNNFLLKKLMDPLTIADAGIALCHLVLAARRSGEFASVCREDGVGETRKNYAYVWTVVLKGSSEN